MIPDDTRNAKTGMRLTRLTLCLGACLALMLSWWWQRGLEVALPEPPLPVALPCVSYSPFRHMDINPLNPASSVTPGMIAADLALLRPLTRCIRTYGLSQGLDAVPGIAADLGMEVRLGVWIGRDGAANARELAQGLALARAFPGTITHLIVGNEVLLRRELPPQALATLLQHARAASPVPVTYADVWEFWQRHASLAQHVDMVTVHILPYWEDNPVAVGNAVDHVRRIASLMREKFSDKPVWVGETGWPAAGRQRAGAVPGKVEQVRFARELLAERSVSGLDFNFIEAFDQQWKRNLEGAMGGAWGLFTASGEPRVAWRDAVREDENWRRGWIGAALGATAGLFPALMLAGIRRRPAALAATVLFSAFVGAVLPWQWQMALLWDRTPREFAASFWLGLLGILAACAPWLEKARYARFLKTALLFSAASAALVLLLDPRYRSFPWWWFILPAAAWAGAWLARQQLPATMAEDALLARLLALFAVLIAVQEGPANTQAQVYAGLLLSLALLGGAWPRSRPHAGSCIHSASASSTAGAQSSAV